jgi:membrane-bound lytic murein transglycosylase A
VNFIRFARLLLAALLALELSACKTPQPQSQLDYAQPLPPGALALRKLSPSEYPDFSAAILASNVPDLTRAIDHSLTYLAAPSSQAFFPYGDISHDRAVASLEALKQIITSQGMTPGLDGGRQFDATIKGNFEVYQSIGAPDPNSGGYTNQVLFTAYCTPIYTASLTRTGPYQWPIYKRPADLITDSTGDHAWRRQPEGSQVPYYTRTDIEENHLLDGQELVWLTNRLDAYIIAVQGSARLQLTDGRTYEIGYSGNNGYPYVSPMQQMLADGVITNDQYNLRGLRAYFTAHPDDMDKYLHLNQRYIFFTERPGGPFGSLNQPVTPMATIATDKSVYPRAMPAFVVTTVPTQTADAPWRAIMLDQDTGGGIRASGRCDLYMGTGPEPEQLAGRERATGQLYYLAIKPELMNQKHPITEIAP